MSVMSATGSAAVVAGSAASSAAAAAPGAVAAVASSAASSAAATAPVAAQALSSGAVSMAAVAPEVATMVASVLAAAGVSTSIIYGTGVALVKLANCILAAAKVFDEAVGLTAKLSVAKQWASRRVTECKEISAKLGTLTREALDKQDDVESPEEVQSEIKRMLA